MNHAEISQSNDECELIFIMGINFIKTVKHKKCNKKNNYTLNEKLKVLKCSFKWSQVSFFLFLLMIFTFSLKFSQFFFGQFLVGVMTMFFINYVINLLNVFLNILTSFTKY